MLPVLGTSVYNLYKTYKAGARPPLRWYPLKPLQFHMHSTCEHLVGGADCAIELHLVRQGAGARGCARALRLEGGKNASS